MFKKLIFIIPCAIATLCLSPLNTYALDDINTEAIAEPTAATSPETLSTINTAPSNSEASSQEAPSESETTNNPETTDEANQSVAGATDEEEVIDHAFTQNPVLAYIQENFPEIANPETWPLLISAAALILTILLIVIINLVAHRKSKKLRMDTATAEVEQ